jgi:SAM-dependent methyltransferase
VACPRLATSTWGNAGSPFAHVRQIARALIPHRTTSRPLPFNRRSAFSLRNGEGAYAGKVNVENPFVGQSVAARYAHARPALHGHVVDLLLARTPRVHRAIDVACGSGLSTLPLSRIAEHVVGMDRSPEMLAFAPPADRVSYVQGAAERLPFEDASAGLATVCSGIHWFRGEALNELHRVLEDEGTLAIYDVWFPAEMVDEPRFAHWMSNSLAPRYPSIPKNYDNVKTLPSMGFRQVWSADLRFEISLSLESLVAYLMTHSDRIAAIRVERESEAEQTGFLREGLRSLFAHESERNVVFGIWVRTYVRHP